VLEIASPALIFLDRQPPVHLINAYDFPSQAANSPENFIQYVGPDLLMRIKRQLIRFNHSVKAKDNSPTAVQGAQNPVESCFVSKIKRLSRQYLA
jgi:hypothetical protein